MYVYVDGMVISMDDYKSLEISGAGKKGWTFSVMEKGQMEELEILVNCLQSGGNQPVSLDQRFSATQISFDVEAAIRS